MTSNQKIIESMKQFAESYAKSTDTFFCIDLEVTESVILGLAKNKETVVSPLLTALCNPSTSPGVDTVLAEMCGADLLFDVSVINC